jgi:hypothetical protein
MIGAALGSVAGIASAIMQANAQADARNLNYLNLFEQKRQAREREALAKATRSDAHGNKVEYLDGQGFVTKVTPFTKAILNSQQKEQLAQFRDDAPRVRGAAERMDKRAVQADEVYGDKFNQYRYGREKSEKEYIAEAIRNTIDSRRENKNTGANELLSRSAMRLGNSGAAANLYKAAQESSTQQTLSEAIAEAKRQGTQQFLAEKGAKTSATFGELNNLRSIADAVMAGNMNWDSENAALSGRQDGALNGLIQTNAANSQAVGGAYGSAADAAGKSPDLGGLISSLQGIKLPNGSPQKSEQERLLADLLLKQQIGSAQIGINNNNNALSAYKGNTGNF